MFLEELSKIGDYPKNGKSRVELYLGLFVLFLNKLRWLIVDIPGVFNLSPNRFSIIG